MKDLIIRNLDDALLVELKRRAWHQGLPLEESLRRLLIASINSENESEEQLAFMLRIGAHRRGLNPRIALHA